MNDDRTSQAMAVLRYEIETFVCDGQYKRGLATSCDDLLDLADGDGLNEGFAALVNYHKLDGKLLETLIYTYLGDWISRQGPGQGCGNSSLVSAF